jgi:hypothetical protein
VPFIILEKFINLIYEEQRNEKNPKTGLKFDNAVDSYENKY